MFDLLKNCMLWYDSGMNITGKELRQKYLDFFKNYPGLEHHVLDSAPLIPSDGEQLEGKEKVLFTTAGMQPLIPYLTGKKEPPFKRLVDCQKCVRTDDIEEVGDNTHHTFFEMLGNWSIGDYWKKEAIEMSYKFLVEELGIEKQKLSVTVFEGDSDAPKDEEAANAWKEMGISEDRISYLGKEDNWWPTSRREVDGTWKNAFGPCGPDTEIFYWTGEGEPEGRPENNEKWVEIWNNVFMQYNRKEDGMLEDLPTKNVDTGMGMERTLSILAGKKNAYETDLFEPIKNRLEEICAIDFNEDLELNKYFRIIADHTKASVMLISAGAEPSNKLQGYITRRLLRRAIWYGENYLNITVPFMHKLVESVIEIYSDVYPELNEYREHVKVIINEEEVKFRKTIAAGKRDLPKLLDQYTKQKGADTLTPNAYGEFAYKMFETYGFPADIVKDYLISQGWAGNLSDFDEAFEQAKVAHQEASRSASAGAFKGGLAGHSEIEIIYHTITHLLHQALRDVLGESVYQKGSNITPERLRFDFSFDRKMTEEEVKRTEEIINERIEQDLQVDQMNIPIEEAREKNAIGLFNDTYEKVVSVYAIGPEFEYEPEAQDKRERGGYYSMEFCGGPHVERTSKIGKVVIQKEEAVAAGIRRIRAVVA